MKNSEITLNCCPRSNDGWTTGTAEAGGAVWDFQVKHYDEPSHYGIAGGRISKLWLRCRGAATPALNYDRGWERTLSPWGKDAAVNAVYRALLARFN